MFDRRLCFSLWSRLKSYDPISLKPHAGFPQERRRWVLYLPMLSLLSGLPLMPTSLTGFGVSGVGVPKLSFLGVSSCWRTGYFWYSRLFLVGVLCRFGDASLEAVGGGAASKLYRVSHGHDVDVAQNFVNSSSLLHCFFRRRVKPVTVFLEEICQNGSSQGRWDALCGGRKSVCDQGPCWRLRSLEPWTH